jgi:putative Mg2+ transporter-C (MgtC) family protein
MGTNFRSHHHSGTVASIHANHRYFTEFTVGKAVMYSIASLYVLATGLASVAELFLTIPCTDPGITLEYENPAYDGSRCPHIRHLILMGLTKEECSFGRRLVASVLLGGFIGWERRQADRPAGIRTMSLVSLGSCLFTITSTFAFVRGPMNWDASRVSAAIPSGVGFLGAGLIFKKTEKDTSLVVHGLTTAASVWISAAVGIACGGELYFAASFGVAIMMLLLRFGPRGFDAIADDDEEEDEAFANLTTVPLEGDGPTDGGYGATTGATPGTGEESSLLSAQDGPALLAKKREMTIRKRASLATMV